MTKTEIKHKKTLSGVVVSDKMDKTVVVLVDRYVKDPKYGKFRRISKRFKAHDEENRCSEGDKVVIEETTPVSKDKNFIIKEVVKKESK